MADPATIAAGIKTGGDILTALFGGSGGDQETERRKELFDHVFRGLFDPGGEGHGTTFGDLLNRPGNLLGQNLQSNLLRDKEMQDFLRNTLSNIGDPLRFESNTAFNPNTIGDFSGPPPGDFTGIKDSGPFSSFRNPNASPDFVPSSGPLPNVPIEDQVVDPLNQEEIGSGSFAATGGGPGSGNLGTIDINDLNFSGPPDFTGLGQNGSGGFNGTITPEMILDLIAKNPNANQGRDVRAFAQGGLVTEPTIGLVGENGPEMIMPVQAGGTNAANNFGNFAPVVPPPVLSGAAPGGPGAPVMPPATAPNGTPIRAPGDPNHAATPILDQAATNQNQGRLGELNMNILQQAIDALMNVPGADELFGLKSGNVISGINENAGARGAFGGSANQTDLVRGLGDLEHQSQLTHQSLQNQAFGNALAGSGQAFNQGITTAQFNNFLKTQDRDQQMAILNLLMGNPPDSTNDSV
jgi:hypothetical protein